MLEKSMKKLLDNGHVVLLDDLPPELRTKIKNASSSYTIPADVAFKEGSVSLQPGGYLMQVAGHHEVTL